MQARSRLSGAADGPKRRGQAPAEKVRLNASNDRAEIIRAGVPTSRSINGSSPATTLGWRKIVAGARSSQVEAGR